jgi:hypothetical protein
MEHRGDPRRPTDVAVRFVTRPSISGSGRILDISPTGAFLETRAPLRHLSLLYLQPFDMPTSAGAGGRIAATVVRSALNGYGLEWCEFGAAATAVYAALTVPFYDLAGGRQLALELERRHHEPPPAYF